jgi:hypothetical protein
MNTTAVIVGLFAYSADDIVRGLAVVGGAVLGGLVVGLLAQLITKAFTGQKVPRWPLFILRLLGAIAAGWLVALFVFGGGGSGLGGLGGWGLGSGPGKGDGATPTTRVKPGEGEGKKDGGPGPVAAGETLRIEVLGEEPLKKLEVSASRCYRIDRGDGPQLVTFNEVKDAVKKRQQRSPPLRHIEVVVYKDSPDKDGGLVSRLKNWAADLDVKGDGKMKVDLSLPDANAPVP